MEISARVNNRPNTIAVNKSLSILFINESLLIAKWKRRFLRSRLGCLCLAGVTRPVRAAACNASSTERGDWPVGQHIRGHVYFTLGAIDKRHVDMFQVFRQIPAPARRRFRCYCCYT
jgi:hypothetical protein